ncbi:hypothetical protein B5F40_07465 [Gordonibacter sp. An230]|uniref:hypothetical protein n=1 Tax=Gordonibacter sp. An230 TaxID=1965592 RepID=UPI000B3952F3|nr:hypothetical protein [Gordonibacter sp. An230]OUO90291.1 hypothetical protein B5F40_07465 [Gordonibacter sp. An230]
MLADTKGVAVPKQNAEHSLNALSLLTSIGASASQPSESIGPDGTRIVFYEKENRTDSEAAEGKTRVRFIGCFTIDGFMIQNEQGIPVDAGFGAEFDTAGGPNSAWVWFCRPVNEAVKSKFEKFFMGTFDDIGMLMGIDPQTFLDFADSASWTALECKNDGDDGPTLVP